jgi:hypothetical protein
MPYWGRENKPMGEKKSLKEQNAWLLRAILALHFVLFSLVAFEPYNLDQWTKIHFTEKFSEILAPGSISLALIFIVKLFFLGMLPAQARDSIVHWRIKDALPGSRAFSQIAVGNPRIVPEILEQNYGPFPETGLDQNRKFYQIYRAYKDETEVLDPHKSYLACRDIATINFILLILLPSLVFWATGSTKIALLYGLLLLSFYTAMALAAQIYSKRMVENVLALASIPGK